MAKKIQHTDEEMQAVEAYEKLSQAVDGGEMGMAILNIPESSAILAMLDDAAYRRRIKKIHEEVYG